MAANGRAALGLLAALLAAGCSGEKRDGGIPAVLRWGGDASGGEPYIVPRDGAEPTGFEGELAAYLAEELGVEGRFVNKDWGQLPQDLDRGDVDLLLNGYEWLPERVKVMEPSVPYLAYRLRLIVRNDSPIKDWTDLKKGTKVGVLKDSAAHRHVEQIAGLEVVALESEGVTGAMEMVAGRRLDATVQDGPAAVWYLQRKTPRPFPDLKMVGEAVAPVTHSYYVMYFRPEDRRLRERVDEAIKKALRTGRLKEIYSRYGLWDDAQEGLQRAADNWPPPETATRPPLSWFFEQLLRAAVLTVELALCAMPLAVVAGLVIAVGRLYGPRWVAAPLAVFVEVIRGTPVLMQLLIIFYVLPQVGVRLPPFWAGVLGLAINYAAYEAENYRAGLLAIPRGQLEAALALGMSRRTALRRVVLPQAVRLVVPPVTNDFISLFKDTSICSVIGVVELASRYRTLAVNYPGVVLQLGLMMAAMYLAMSYPLSLLARRLERRQRAVTG
jgi:polar amino acid transport system substrate-binding protein